MIAQEPAEKPQLQAYHVEAGEVTVDGRLDEVAWQRAAPVERLYQYVPSPGGRMSEDTRIRVLYDAHHLYLGVWCYDREPDKITARSMTRDFDLSADDYIYFLFDTFHDQRNGYVFSVNPLGARYDALVSRGTNSNVNWDGVWTAKTSIDEEGWKAEMRFPFNSLSFSPESEVWGFNLSRNIRRISQRGRWTGARPDIRTRYAAEAGDILGLKGMQQGLGLEWRPFVVGRYREENDDSDWLGDVGMDFRYRITPDLSATLSYNTDFAETEVDDRQVNLTRFPLFFPEKRAFFLEDSGIYEFGGLTTSSSSREGLQSLLVPYFTRRIGLSDSGEIVPVRFADKVAGRVGSTEIGFTHVMLDSKGDIDRQHVMAGRVVQHLGKQSSFGVLATAGDPNSKGDNFLFGVDYHYRSSDYLGGKFLQADLFAMNTFNRGAGAEDTEDYAYGLSLSYPNEPFYLSGKMVEIGDDFDPALGFVRRQGVRAYATSTAYTYRPENVERLREFEVSVDTEHFTDLSNRLQTGEIEVTPLSFEFASADELKLTITHRYDSPEEAFDLLDAVTIPADDYAWMEYGLEIETAQKRALAMTLEARLGEFYDGTRRSVDFSTSWWPNKHVSLELGYGYNQIELPEGDIDTHLASARMRWKFTPDLIWSHFIQYDSLSDSIGFQSVLRWEYLPGSELFAVAHQTYLKDRSGLGLENQELAVKVGATIRF